MSEYYRNLNHRLSELNAIKATRKLDDQEVAERRWLVAEIYEELELIEAYESARAECIHNDPTGQDLDAFYGEDY